MSTSRRVLLVGWDAADWKVIYPLLEKGKLPHLKQLLDNGVSGNLATLSPALSPMLWTSIATGKRPHKHGIYGFAEPDPHGGGVRPITNLSRKTKAIWNILSQNERRCIVVGWWPSHPAEPLPNGVMVSNSYHRAPNADVAEPWPIAKGTVYPAALAQILASKRIHPSEVDKAYLLGFVPKLGRIDSKIDRRPNTVAKIIADCTNIHSAALHLIQDVDWDFAAVYYDAIDHFGHGFMRYHPPRQKWVQKREFDLYCGVIEAAYRYHDSLLGDLLKAAGENTTVLLMSDHGFHPDTLRPSAIPMEPAGRAYEHRYYGIFALKGPNIRTGERIHGASVLDICPTLLSLFGLPVGQDMDGKPLATVWSDPLKTEIIPSWDTVSGHDGTHPCNTRLDPDDSREALRQLEALGYIEPLPENTEKAADKARRELSYNLACSYIDAQMYEAAAELFGALWSEGPDEHRHGAKLYTCQMALGYYQQARITFEQLRVNRQRYSAEAAKVLKTRREELKKRKPEELKLSDYKELDRLSAQARLSLVPMQQMEAMLLLAENKPGQAIPILKKLEKISHSDPDFWIQLGRNYSALKQWNEAQSCYEKAMELDVDNAHAHFGLAQIHLTKRHNYKAADAALTAIGLLYQFPSAHFLLGVALHRLGQINHAVEALRICVNQNANFLAAHHRLAYIYEKRLNDSVRAGEHRTKFRDGILRLRAQRVKPDISSSERDASVWACSLSKPMVTVKRSDFDVGLLSASRADVPFVTIVSGLPRSGTSLMMQMLAAGGLPPLVDSHRPADEDNPRGYFEFEPAKTLRNDTSWMRHGKGRVIKLVAQLLPFLPDQFDYRVILMDRSLDEVVASQKVMLDRNSLRGAALSLEKLRGVYQEQMNGVSGILKKRKVPLLRVSYYTAISDPGITVERVRKFLGVQLDPALMASVVDPSLYRQRSVSGT